MIISQIRLVRREARKLHSVPPLEFLEAPYKVGRIHALRAASSQRAPRRHSFDDLRTMEPVPPHQCQEVRHRMAGSKLRHVSHLLAKIEMVVDVLQWVNTPHVIFDFSGVQDVPNDAER